MSHAGVLTTHATTIEERRLHGVELSEPLLLRAAGGARCIAIVTGLRVGRGAERSAGALLLPPAPRDDAERVAAAVLGEREPPTPALAAHGVRARRRRYARALAPWALVIAALVAAWALAGLPARAWLARARAGAGDGGPGRRSLSQPRPRGRGRAAGQPRRLARAPTLCAGVRGDDRIQRAPDAHATTSRPGHARGATTAAGRQRYEVQDVEVADALRIAEAAVPGLLAPFLDEAPAWRRRLR